MSEQTDLQTRINAHLERISHHPHYQRREGQIQIIGAIWKLLDGQFPHQHLALEGPVGSGKSLGYCIPSIAKIEHDRAQGNEETKLVIATAAVNLQQQLIHKDLPQVLADSDLTCVLAAGRGRYFCQKRANALLSSGQNMSLLDTNEQGIDNATVGQIDALHTRLRNKTWSGLKDDLDEHEGLAKSIWDKVKAEPQSCDPACPYYYRCPFIRSRQAIKDADIIVANHALVCADAKDNNILPEPEQTIYVFDEAHHLRNTFRDQFATRVNLSKLAGLGELKDNLMYQAIHIANTLSYPNINGLNQLSERIGHVAHDAHALYDVIRDDAQAYFAQANYFEQQKGVWNVSGGRLAHNTCEIYQSALKSTLMCLLKPVRKLCDYLREKPQDDAVIMAVCKEIFSFEDHIEEAYASLELFFNDEQSFSLAKWIQRIGDDGFVLHTCPVDVAKDIQRLLFNKAQHVIMTSATMRALGSFERVLQPLGLSSNDVSVFTVKSPFDYTKQSSLTLHDDMVDASFKNEAKHTEQIHQRVVKDFLANPKVSAGLLLFASKRQMWQWFKLQSKNDKRMIVLQSNDIERHALVKKHKKRIDAGKKSLLVGVQSLAEGLDLPRQYLTWLGIAKIPFSDPFGNVVDACEAELLKAKGMDPFFHMALADASTRLTQYTGRAIRSEDDTCQVHIFDSRMNRHWAQSLLANLPPMPITYKSA